MAAETSGSITISMDDSQALAEVENTEDQQTTEMAKVYCDEEMADQHTTEMETVGSDEEMADQQTTEMETVGSDEEMADQQTVGSDESALNMSREDSFAKEIRDKHELKAWITQNGGSVDLADAIANNGTDKLEDADKRQIEQLQECLVKAIKERKRDVVKAILTNLHKNAVHQAMSTCKKQDRNDNLCCGKVQTYNYTTPLRLLIKDMPDMAEMFLDTCIINTEYTSKVELNFSFIDDFDTDWVQEQLIHDHDTRVEDSNEVTKHTTEEGQVEGTTGTNYLMQEAHFEAMDHSKGTVNSEVSEVRRSCFKDNFKRAATVVKTLLLIITYPVVCILLCLNAKAFKNIRPESHTVSYMIEYSRYSLLKHPLVKTWIEQKWENQARRVYIPYMMVYASFLAVLSAFALVLPRPVENPACNSTLMRLLSCNDRSNMSCNRTATTKDLCGVEPYQITFLLYARIIVILLVALLILYEYMQLTMQQIYYLKSWENFIQIFLFVGTIIFVLNFANPCTCGDSAIWQLGAFVVASTWFNLLILLRSVAGPINLFFLIIRNYLKLVYLPILLLSTFSVPFYMLFARNKAYATPSSSLMRTLVATTGDSGFDGISDAGALPTAGAILFFAFLILVLVLFNNMLIGLAIGDKVNNIDVIQLQCKAEFIIASDNGTKFVGPEPMKELPIENFEHKETDLLRTEARLLRMKEELVEELAQNY